MIINGQWAFELIRATAVAKMVDRLKLEDRILARNTPKMHPSLTFQQKKQKQNKQTYL